MAKTLRFLRTQRSLEVPRPGPGKWWHWSPAWNRWVDLRRIQRFEVPMEYELPNGKPGADLREAVKLAEHHCLVVWTEVMEAPPTVSVKLTLLMSQHPFDQMFDLQEPPWGYQVYGLSQWARLLKATS